jgi:hypothetical protein
MRNYKLNAKEKINLLGVINIVPLIMMICFFIINYFQQKNIYIAEINQEVRQYILNPNENAENLKTLEK